VSAAQAADGREEESMSTRKKGAAAGKPARIETKPRKLTHEAWLKEAADHFGADPMGWKFVCPSCGHVASVADWRAAGATEGEVAFSCVGRHLPNAKNIGERPGPCNYAGGGLFKLNPVTVSLPNGHESDFFEFAPAEGGAA